MAKKVLVVDDEKLIVKGIRYSLEQDGMTVEVAYDGRQALEMAQNNAYDVILLDVMLPELNGFEVCQMIRDFSDVPIIMLTAKGDDMDKILGLEYGADDYIKKPFSVMELITRVKALLRRTETDEAGVLDVGEIELNHERHAVTVSGKQVELTFKEYELLRYLMANKNIVLSRDSIVLKVWGTEFEGESRTVDMHIKTLRQKLGDAGSRIRTVRNVGYVIE
jgi:DNA-binding response OmpR family regulator